MSETEDSSTETAPATGSGSSSGSGGWRRISDSDFAAAKELYELGKGGIADLAKQFGVHRTTLSQKFKAAGVRKGSRASEVADATRQVVEKFAERRAERIEETRNFSYGVLKTIDMLTHRILVDQAKATAAALSFESRDDDFKALRRAQVIINEGMRARLEVLQADQHIDADALPPLILEDLTDKDILEHFKSTGVLDEDATIEDLNTENLG